MLSRWRCEDGLGLVEAVIAGGLLLIAIVGGISVFDSSRRESETGERQQVAALQAQAEVERLRDIPYSELAINPAAGELWNGLGGPGDPTNRVEWGATATFRTGQSEAEEMVFAGAGGEGVAAQTSLAVPVGDATRTLDVFRFVSWRDEECPVADAAGATGPLAALVDDSAAAADSILGGSALGALLGPLWSLLNPIVRDRVTDAKSLVEGIDEQLAELDAAIAGIEEIDPCDAEVEALQEFEDSLGPLGPLLTTLDSRLTAYRAGCTLLLCPGTGSALFTSLSAAITDLENGDYEGVIAGLVASLGEVETTDTTHNTKRVTVAVVLEPEPGSGPAKPVWATSVVSDPNAGLLTGP